MEYAKSLIKRRADKNAHAEDEEEAEESWTFVGTDEPDPEVTTRRFSEMGA
jgi:sterol 3beta-glucosyltransferase